MRRFHAHYATEGGDARALIARYGGVIDRLARRITARTGMPELVDDLWSAGAVGLLDAASRFDPARDIRFESFAEHRIRGAMIDELRKMDHLPRRLRSDLDRIGRGREALERKLGRSATVDELAAELGIEVEGLGELEALSQPPIPLPDELPLASDELPADERLAGLQLQEGIAEAIAALPERLQLLMSLHYVEGLTYKEIAGIFGVSEPRVCQLHGDAIKKVRAVLADDD